jgi:hypothetical protein
LKLRVAESFRTNSVSFATLAAIRRALSARSLDYCGSPSSSAQGLRDALSS